MDMSGGSDRWLLRHPSPSQRADGEEFAKLLAELKVPAVVNVPVGWDIKDIMQFAQGTIRFGFPSPPGIVPWCW